MTVSEYYDAKFFYIDRTMVTASESKTKERLFEDPGENKEQVIYEHKECRFTFHMI